MKSFLILMTIILAAPVWAQEASEVRETPAPPVEGGAPAPNGAAALPATPANATAGSPVAPQPSPLAKPTVTTAPRPPAKRMNREKEAEGSEAKNRFTSDPVVKSQYRVGGQALEVDPD